jgi:uncharacterized protein (DUF924 family)
MPLADSVLDFWLNEIGEEGWYKGGPEIDAACEARFGEAVDAARNGAWRAWLSRPETALAYLILTDQMPRNIYRGTALAFFSDRLAQSGASLALARGHDLRIEGPARQFFYMPYEHAENIQAQSLAVCLFMTRTPEDPEDKDSNLLHARAHREIIRRFGRFPMRNAALNRASSRAEERFLAEEGYAGVLHRLRG